MIYQFIRDHSGRFQVQRMCRALEVLPSVYYAWLRRPESRRAREDCRLLAEIKAVHAASRGTYGSQRIHAEFKAREMRHARNRIARLMRENGIKAKQKRKFRATTDSNHSYPVAPNLLERDFKAQKPKQRWLADIAYIHRLYRTRSEARSDIFWFIEVFYNRSRRHSSLGYLTPTEFEIVRLAA